LLIPFTVVATRVLLVMPCGMKKYEGDAVATEGLLVASVMYTPPAGAAVPSATGKLTVLPAATVTLAGIRMPPPAGCVTVTVALAPATFGALAVIETDPGATPVTGTDTLAAPAPKVTDAGTVATVTSLEFKLTVSAAGAAADRFSVRFCVALPLMVRLAGEKLRVRDGGVTPVTCTWEVAAAYPGADAVIVADPAL